VGAKIIKIKEDNHCEVRRIGNKGEDAGGNQMRNWKQR